MRRRVLLAAPGALAAALAVTAIATASPSFSMKLGSTFTITGRTGSAPGEHTRATGKVFVSGRWGAGPWRVIASTATDATGSYRLTIKPGRRGNLTLRIAPPDHHLRRYLLRVR